MSLSPFPIIPHVIETARPDLWGNCTKTLKQKDELQLASLKARYGNAVQENYFSIKLSDSAIVRLRNGTLVSLCNADLEEINSLIKASGIVISRMHTISEETADKLSEKSSVNLNSFYIARIRSLDSAFEAMKLIYSSPLVDEVDALPSPAPTPVQ